MVKEFLNVFPKDLLGLPLDCKIEFFIDLIPGIYSISMAPYQMTKVDLVELNKQL